MAAKKKSVSKNKKKQNSSIKTDLPQPKLYPLSNKKPSVENKKSIYHAVDVMSSEQESQPAYHEGVYQKFPKEIIQSHIPQYNVVPYSRGKHPRPLSTAQIQKKRETSKSNTFFPKFFMNLYLDLDYMVLQDIYANSMGGRIIDRKEELKFGNGIRPVLKLRNPKIHGDDAASQNNFHGITIHELPKPTREIPKLKDI